MVKLPLSKLRKNIAGVEAQIHLFLTTTLDGGDCSTSHCDRFTPAKEPRYPLSTRLSGRFVEEKSPLPCRNSNPRPTSP